PCLKTGYTLHGLSPIVLVKKNKDTRIIAPVFIFTIKYQNWCNKYMLSPMGERKFFFNLWCREAMG
ncbi:hypothetical protein, partial [Geobacillus sp. AYS3]|uniref:hypothetical protein n=1 Tax=Geobacillus sp. AYS3 TaxID=2603623 RepID=UPI001C9CB143